MAQTRALVAVAAVAVWAAAALEARQSVTRTLYVAVTDKAGSPVLDMTSADLEVKEGGKVQTIAVRAATTPLRVALLVSDAGAGGFQGGALRFCEAVLGHGEVSMIAIITQPEKLTDYTADGSALRDALQQLGRRSARSQGGAQVVDTLLETTKGLRREGTRPAIVLMRAGGEASTSVRIDHIQNALRDSGAVFYVVSTTRGEAAINPGMGSVASLTLPTVLNDSSRESGGRRIDVVGGSLVPTMQQVAAELINRYEITYTLPAGAKPSDSVSVSSKRRDVTVRAPTKLGNRPEN